MECLIPGCFNETALASKYCSDHLYIEHDPNIINHRRHPVHEKQCARKGCKGEVSLRSGYAQSCLCANCEIGRVNTNVKRSQEDYLNSLREL